MAKRKQQPRPEVWPASATRDVDYDADALEFLKEVDRFKLATGIRHLSWHDVFLIARELGYRKVAEPTELPRYCVKKSPKIRGRLTNQDGKDDGRGK